MTPVLDRDPLTTVLPPTSRGVPRAMRCWKLGASAGYACDAVLVVEERGRPDETYTVCEEPVLDGSGRLFAVHRLGVQDAYHVWLSRDGQGHSCDCPAGVYHAGRVRGGQPVRCRHLLSMLEIMADGLLNPEPPAYPTFAEVEAECNAAGLEAVPF